MTKATKLFPTALAVFFVLCFPSAGAHAQNALSSASLIEYIRSRDDLPPKVRQTWEREIKIRFGGAAFDEDTKTNNQITVAKAILSAAIFMEADPKKAAQAAFTGYGGVLGFVPPPLAIHYNILSLEGRKPKGSMEALTFDFPRYYNDEIAPELVTYWEQSIKNREVPDYLIEETKETLKKTRVLMRPLLTDKLRLLSALEKAKIVASGDQRATVEKDMREVEDELARAFSGVAQTSAVLDRSKPPYERLTKHLSDLGQTPSAGDLALDPNVGAKDLERLRNEARREAERREVERREAEKKEAARQEAERKEAERKEAEKKEAARQEAEKKEAARIAKLDEREREAATREAEKREAARLAAERKQAERREAERREAEKKDAARQEAERKEAEKRDRQRAEADRAGAAAPGMVSYPAAKVKPQLVSTIKPWLGTPYLWGGTQKVKGTDCSGFTRGVAEEGFELTLPRVSRDQHRIGVPINREQDLRPGDLLFFDTKDVGHITHVGYWTGDGIAHASSSKGVVQVGWQTWLKRAYRGARRVIEPR